MKKLIAILAVMIVLAGVVFATSGDTIRLQSTVSKVTPNFKITVATTDGSQNPVATYATGKDISEEDITLTFTLRQEGNVQVVNSQNVVKDYSKFRGTATLTVTLKPFKATIDSQVYSPTTGPAITGTTKANDISGKLTFEAPTTDEDAEENPTAEFVLNYLGKKVLDTQTTNVGTVTAKWTHDDTLPMAGDGTVYTADVVLTYTIQ